MEAKDDLVDRLRTEADLCRNETADDVAALLDEAAARIEVLAARREHTYWRAGEIDCPRDILAPNGELHTLRCKVCGRDNVAGVCDA